MTPGSRWEHHSFGVVFICVGGMRHSRPVLQRKTSKPGLEVLPFRNGRRDTSLRTCASQRIIGRSIGLLVRNPFANEEVHGS